MPESPGVRTIVDALDRRIAQRAKQRTTTAISDARWAYRMAAAVLVSFELPTLDPFAMETSSEPAGSLVLLDDIVEAPGEKALHRVTLKTEVRRAALSRLGRDRWKVALEANPRRQRDRFQLLYEEWLLGGAPDFELQGYVELTMSAQIVEWLEGLVSGLPPLDKVQRIVDGRSVYALFEHLASTEFTDREAELSTLREFVGVLAPSTWRDAVARQIRSWRGLRKRPPLVIEGLGGVGKSALLGRFLLEHVNDAAGRFPFAYIAFDNPLLKVDEPLTIITEMARQLQLLYPEHTEQFAGLTRAIDEYGARSRGLQQRTSAAVTRRGRTAELMSVDETLYTQFAACVAAVAKREGEREETVQAPFLLVLDTFEEAQYQGQERLLGFLRMLERLDERCAELRIVISMRPPLAIRLPARWKDASRLTLTELPFDAAVSLLGKLGVTDTQLASTVARQVRGNPLNLKLAARLVSSVGGTADGLRGLQTTSWLLFSVSDEVIRGQLYGRILDHIHDPRVRRLAHPGMVLRRVTPDVIRRVLSEPCGVPIKDDADAQQLLEILAREHTLVSYEAAGVLRYRQDIRKPTLALLKSDRPAQVRAINEAARAYYALGSTREDVAEELYHRLALDEEPFILESLSFRWDDEVIARLFDALDELPPRARVWLAVRLGVDIPADVRAQADVEAWERSIGRKVRELLRYDDARNALGLLQERRERTPASALFALEAKAYTALERPEDARRVLEQGIASVAEQPNRGRMAELLWLEAQLLEQQGATVDADALLARAETVAGEIPDRLCLLQILVQRLLLRRGPSLPSALVAEGDQLTNRLAEVALALPEEAMDREPGLVRAAATLLGPAYRDAFVRIVSRIGVGLVLPPRRAAFGAELTQQLRGDASKEVAPILRDLERSDLSLDHLLPQLLQLSDAEAVTLPAIEEILVEQPYSLSAANLAGIDAYREPWELEHGLEAA